MRKIAIAALALALVGCNESRRYGGEDHKPDPAFEAKCAPESIHIGMTQAEVIQLCGEPLQSLIDPNQTQWFWDGNSEATFDKNGLLNDARITKGVAP